MPYFDKDRNKWRAVIRGNRKRVTRLFDNIEEAINFENQIKHGLMEPHPKGDPNPKGRFIARMRTEEDFKKRYRDKYIRNDNYTIDLLFNDVMKEIGLSVRFKDLKKIIDGKDNGRHIPNKQRFRILARDNFTCKSCGRKAPDVKLHIDHILPFSKGGINEDDNLQTLCDKCNSGKSNKIYVNQFKDISGLK